MALLIYHLSWLAAHPERDADWLQQKLREGFHVHHVDGNGCNHAPDNLVLIDGTDHMRLHRRPGTLRKALKTKTHTSTERRAAAGALMYEAAANGAAWKQAPFICDYSVAIAKQLARQHAELFNKPWPPRIRDFSMPQRLGMA